MASKSRPRNEQEQDGLELEEHHPMPMRMTSRDTTEAQDRDGNQAGERAMPASPTADPDAIAPEEGVSQASIGPSRDGHSDSMIKKLETWWVRYVRPTLDHEQGDPRDFLGTSCRL